METRHPRGLTRFGAPAAFLAAVTIAVLLIKSALSGSTHDATTAAFTSAKTTHAATRSHRRPTSVASATIGARYYTIQSGDTLGAIALREKTTVAELLRLNPGIDATALHSGQRIRVG